MTFEVVGNLHTHTAYSDGTGSHEDIAAAALRAGLDFVVVTDHNVWVDGLEGYRRDRERRVLLLVGEEIHDQIRDPQKNHLLVFGAGRELAPLAPSPQRLLDAVRQAGGVAFIAHPVDPEAPLFRQGDLGWVSWEVEGFAGLEIWNAMSEFKSLLRSRLAALFYGFNPELVATAPFPQALQQWDELLAAGRRVAVIGGADAHAFDIPLGPLRRVVFPYEFHFRAVNTHVLMDGPLSGEPAADARRIYDSLGRGRCFAAYDLPASARGFRFTAQGKDTAAEMGDSISFRHGVTLQVWTPARADVRLLQAGTVVREWSGQQGGAHTVSQPGPYRAEAYLEFRGRKRGWIFSSPIYVTP
ncbi:MAG: hypothetical protein A2Y93_17245 [Chloroflexi bacterium RBG_13_68_17]|nr:MAG: hypothetical protein A2Y93_17245 [Chloroflexi bacterium RBG_13_68_17]